MDRELLYVFGTGNAAVTNLYNTCFALRDSDEYFMVDAGGGNGILKILDNMQVPVHRIHHIFVTHEHTDHILGIVWMIRMRRRLYLLPRGPGGYHPHPVPPDHPGKAFPFSGQPDPPGPLKGRGSPAYLKL